jgi:hypothetical protein
MMSITISTIINHMSVKEHYATQDPEPGNELEASNSESEYELVESSV